MMKIPLDLPRLTSADVVVDNSILSTMTCSTEGAMRHVLHLTTPTAKVELVCGSALHEGLARWLVTGDPDEALARFDTIYRPWSAAHVPKLDQEGKLPRLRWSQVHRIFERWLRTHDLKKWTLVVDPCHVEIPVWAPLGGQWKDRGGIRWGWDRADLAEIDLLASPKKRPPVIVFSALLDFIGQKRGMPGGGHWSGDHKSSASLGPWFKDQNEDAAQFTGQLWAAAARGIAPLNGIYINAIELKSLNASEKRCPKHGIPYAKCALEPEHHNQGLLFPITRSRAEIAAWEQTAVGLTKKFLRLRDRVETIRDIANLPMEGRFIYGKCGRCTFRDFCRLGRTPQAAKGFVQDVWNPLEHAFKRGGVREAVA